MKITKMDLYPVSIPLLTPFTTAIHSVDVKKCVLVRLESEDGCVGWGEAAPEVEITRDDCGTAFNLLDTRLRETVIGMDLDTRNDLEALLLGMEPQIEKSSTAVAALDIALHDLWTRSENIPLCEYFGGAVGAVPTSISIGIMEERRLFQTIQRIIDSGAAVIKLKIGDDSDADLKTISRFRDSFGYDITLRLDANQGYSVQQALQLFNKIEQFNIEFIEQPVPAGNLLDLKKVCSESPIPVMADEAVSSESDLQKLVGEKICNKVNLKLMKAGGLYQVNKMIDLCYSNKIECMIGCMIETPIGISAGVHLAAQDKSVKWTDLDGHLFFENIERVFPGLSTRKGKNLLKNRPGLGVDVHSDRLEGLI